MGAREEQDVTVLHGVLIMVAALLLAIGVNLLMDALALRRGLVYRDRVPKPPDKLPDFCAICGGSCLTVTSTTAARLILCVRCHHSEEISHAARH